MEPVLMGNEILTIDPDTRTIDVGSDFLLGVETDNDAERVKFQCPKIVGDNLDLSQYHIYIHYQNAKGEKGKYLCEDIEDGGENITFSWLLSQKVTLYKGQTKFLVCAKKTQEETIVWNTTLANGNVLEGLDVDEDIVQQNDDVIEQILLKIEQIEGNISSTIGFDIERYFALQRTGKVYTVKFPLWQTSHSSEGEKLDNNQGLSCTPSTDTEANNDDYTDIPLFKTYDVNAYVDDDGVRHITAMKGDYNFADTGEVDVFVLGMSYYERYWVEDGYWYYSRTDSPKDGYVPAKECMNNDGSVSPFVLYSKYVAGEINGKPYSSKGLKPVRNKISYSSAISYFKQRGDYYTAGLMCEYKYLLTTFWLKYATLNTQSKIAGCTSYNYQYQCAVGESNVKRVVLTQAQANNLVVGSYVSVGTASSGSVDRNNSSMHSIVDSAEITSIVPNGDNAYVYLDVDENFTTTTSCYVSTMHWKSGFSDKVLGKDGSPGNCTNGKYPMVLQGIECMVGGYEVVANAFNNIVDSSGKREVYITNDASELTATAETAMSNYDKSVYSINPTTLNADNYITEMAIDIENGAAIQTEAGASGSGSTVGFCDYIYVDNANSGQREFLLLGSLTSVASAGLSCAALNNGLSNANWNILARLSINAVV